jgi:hypothetical protein
MNRSGDVDATKTQSSAVSRRLSRFRRALTAIERAPIELGPGREYVEAIRSADEESGFRRRKLR